MISTGYPLLDAALVVLAVLVFLYIIVIFARKI